jgi:hypothetical protein
MSGPAAGGRSHYLRELAAKVEGIDPARRTACLTATSQAYEAGSIIPWVARIDMHRGEPPDGYIRIGDTPSMTTSYFNDPNRIWDPFAQDLGHEIVTGEKYHLFNQLVPIAAPAGTIARTRPDFDVLLSAIDDLSARGHNPDVVVVPIQLSSEFSKSFYADIEWLPRRTLSAHGHRLLCQTSSRVIPLDRFFVFDSQAGVWNVMEDPIAGGRLTNVIGRIPGGFGDQIGWVVQTVIAYAIDDPTAFASIDVTAT